MKQNHYEKARELHQKGQYQAARNELAKSDHPKAPAIIKKLDAEHGTRPPRKLFVRLYRLITLALLIVVVAVIVAALVIKAWSAATGLDQYQPGTITVRFACARLLINMVYEDVRRSDVPEATQDAVMDVMMTECETWTELLNDRVMTYCVDAYNNEAADTTIRDEHLMDCLLSRSDDSITTLLSLSLMSAQSELSQRMQG